MDKFMNLERFCCFRRRTGLIIAACLEVVFCVAFLIYYPYVEFPKEFERKYDFSEVIAVLTFNAVIVGFLIIGLVSRNRNCIVPWMFVRTILLCLSCIVMIPLMLLACIVFGPFLFALYRAQWTFEFFKNIHEDNEGSEELDNIPA